MKTPFPKTGYCLIVTISKSRATKKILYPIRHFCKTKQQVDRCLTEIQTALKFQFKGYHITSAYVVHLRFSKSWPLKKEYWSNPGRGFDEELRDKLFVQFIDQFTVRPSGWLMLITPDPKKGKIIHYSAPMPLRLIHREADTEAFMRYSNWPVDPEASDAAMYTVEDLTQYVVSTVKPVHSTPARLRKKNS